MGFQRQSPIAVYSVLVALVASLLPDGAFAICACSPGGCGSSKAAHCCAATSHKSARRTAKSCCANQEVTAESSCCCTKPVHTQDCASGGCACSSAPQLPSIPIPSASDGKPLQLEVAADFYQAEITPQPPLLSRSQTEAISRDIHSAIALHERYCVWRN